MAESILESTADQLGSAQAKITYLGTQSKPIPTVAFSTEGAPLVMDLFQKVQRGGRPYDNDEMPYTQQFRVAADEFRRMLAAVRPIVTMPDAARGPEFLSFAVVRRAGASVEGHEFRIGPATGEVFYRALIDALEPANQAGRAALTRQFSNVFPR